LELSNRDRGERTDVLDFVWNNRVMPLLEEYFYGQRDRLIELLAPFLTDIEAGLQETETEKMDVVIGRLQGDDLMVALAKLAEKGVEETTPVLDE
jgi:hypothetical protein